MDVTEIIGFIITDTATADPKEQEATLGRATAGRNQVVRKLNHLTLTSALHRLGVEPTNRTTLAVAGIDCLPADLPTLTRLLAGIAKTEQELLIVGENIRFKPSETIGLIDLLDALARQQEAEPARAHGRPLKLTDDQINQIEQLRADPNVTASAIAAKMGIGRSTLYNYLNRMKELPASN